MAPLCRVCGRRLRRFGKGRATPEARARVSSDFGDYGDGEFCGLRCGYVYACGRLRVYGFVVRAMRPMRPAE